LSTLRISKKVARHFVESSSATFPSTAILGYHGTSMEAFQMLLQTGSLCGKPVGGHICRNNYNQRVASKGSLHFAPRYENLPPYLSGYCAEMRKEGFDSRIALGLARGFAELNAKICHFSHLANLDLTKLSHYHLTVDLNYTLKQVAAVYRLKQWASYRRVLESRGVGPQELEQIIRKVRADMPHRKGVILVFAAEMTGEFRFKPGDMGTDVCFSCPQGLPYPYILKAIPLGLREKEYFASFRAFVGR